MAYLDYVVDSKPKPTYFAIHGRGPRNCWVCDHKRCKCDRVDTRRLKRAARQYWRLAVAEELSEY